jgi:hypothetical protein
MHSKELTSEQIKSIKKSHRRISYLPIESESSCEDYYLINITTDSLTPDDWGLLLGALQIEIENNEQYNLESIDIIAAYSILKSDVCKSMPLLDLSKAKIHGIPAKKTSVINVAYASATNEPTSLFLKPISELNKNMEEIVLYSIDPNVKVCRKPALYLAMNDPAYLAKINTVEGNFFMFFGWDVQENDFKKKDIKMGRKALIEFADSVIRAENNIKLDFMDFVSFNDDKSDQSERIIKEIKKQKRKKIKEIKKTKEF